MSDKGDDRFEVRLGRIRSPSGARKAQSFFKRVSRGAKAKRSRSGRSRSSPVRQMQFHRRVVVKASIRRMDGDSLAKLKDHLAYVQRDGTDERGQPAELYGPDDERVSPDHLDRAMSFAEQCRDDRHIFRFIVSPEDSAKMQDLTASTRDLVSQLETDLGTKLDWVAANHYDTGQPHTHLIVRGVREDGRDLVIARDYISRRLRERAQALVEAELGPVSQMEGRMRLAATVVARSYTPLDRSLSSQIEKGIVDVGGPVQPGRVWHRQLQVRRLKTLAKMGLAERLGSGRWAVEPDFADTLQKMGERCDIIKALHRRVGGIEGRDPDWSVEGLVTERNRFDPNRVGAIPVTGVVRHYGRQDDTRSGGFVVIDSEAGTSLFAKVADDDVFETLKNGQVVTLAPHSREPKKIDRSIVAFAGARGGLYSEAAHVLEGDRVSQEYALAQVRRLEALRRQGVVARQADGTWRVPTDYLDRVADYEVQRTRNLPASLTRTSRLTLRQMETARAVTWLDRKLAENGVGSSNAKPLGRALGHRVDALKSMGIDLDENGRLPDGALSKLRSLDLQDAADRIGKTLGKPYQPLGQSRRVDGIYHEAIERPSGKFAVIERSREFTLVPWRPVMARRLGKSIAGRVSGAGGISWDVTRRSGPSR